MTSRLSSRHAVAIAAALAAAAAVPARADTLTVQHVCDCWVSNLSDDGHVAVGSFIGDGALFRWTAKDGVKKLGRNSTKAIGDGGGTVSVSGDGKVVAATILDSTGTLATEGRWTPSGGWQELDHPLPPDGGILGTEDSSVWGISSDGNVITGLYWRPGYSDGSAHGSVWSASTGMVGMPTAGGSSRIDDANVDGSVVVGWEEDPNTGSRQAAVWNNGVKTLLQGGGPDDYSEAAQVNKAGTVIVGQSADPATLRSEATRWTWNGTGWTRLGLGFGVGATQSGSSYAIAASDDGSFVAGMFRNKFSTFSDGAFVWTPADGFVDAARWLQRSGVAIHPDNLQILEIPAVSADGHVVAVIARELNFPWGYHSFLVTRP